MWSRTGLDSTSREPGSFYLVASLCIDLTSESRRGILFHSLRKEGRVCEC